MPSEILAFVTSNKQTQTLQSSNTLSGNEDSPPGLFDSFMSEYLSGEDVGDTTDQNAVISTNTGNQENTGQLITFTGSNSVCYNLSIISYSYTKSIRIVAISGLSIVVRPTTSNKI